MKKNLVGLIVLLAITTLSFSQKVDIIPAPVSVKTGTGSFTLSRSTKLVFKDDGEKQTANFFNDYLQKFYGFKLPIVKSATANFISFNTTRFIKAADNDGHYTVNVTPTSAAVQGDSYMGTFYGMQSLLQLLPQTKSANLKLASVAIDDYPRFAYRGMHLDVCRHFFPVEFVKKYIDYLAMHKMNTFHWHLTDDQGWRIEIKKYPKLTSVGGYRNGTIIGRFPGTGNDSIRYGGFYTQAEIKEVVKYAAARFINVIPEIEMPGHASAAIAAYPTLSCFPEESTVPTPGNAWAGTKEGKQVQQTWGVFDDVFCAGNEETFQFLEGVIDEVLQLFPSKYIHVGGDECPKSNWKRCPKCQQRIKDNNLKDEHELQSYFIQRMEKYINSKGRNIIGWDEILEGGLAPKATVMSWRGEEGGIEAAKQQHDVIMTPGKYVYFDHAQSKNEDSVTIGGFTPVELTYSYAPIPAELDTTKAKYILGAQANLWTEYIANVRKVEYQLFPRMSALSEVLWSPKDKRNFNDFESRMKSQFQRYDLWGANYSKAYFEISSTITPAPRPGSILWKMDTKSPGNIFITNKSGNAGMKYTEPIMVSGSGEMEASVVENGKVITTTKRNFSFNKATGKKITLATNPSTTYAGNGGAFGLVNGLVSTQGFNSVEWLGWNGKNMEAVIDLDNAQTISMVTLDVWKQEPSSVYLPKAVEVFVSDNGNEWKLVGQVTEPVNGWANTRKITVNVNDKPTTRYVKVVATNYGIITAGKQGAGNGAFLFVDEIGIN